MGRPDRESNMSLCSIVSNQHALQMMALAEARYRPYSSDAERLRHLHRITLGWFSNVAMERAYKVGLLRRRRAAMDNALRIAGQCGRADDEAFVAKLAKQLY
jgi:hypothetical protein